MNDREQIQQQMLELIYGLLSDDQSAELVERISSDGELARAYAELKEKTELLAEVTKAEAPQPDYAAWKKEADRKHPASPRTSRSTWTVRTWQVVSALAACLLIGALAYPPLAIDPQQQTTALTETSQRLADDYLSLSVTGPSLMATEVRNEFFVSVENAANQPVDAQVEYWFKSPANETVYYGLTESKDGQVVCQIPADEVSSAARLEVIAQRGEAQSTLGLDLQAAPPKPVAVLQTDRDIAEPGQTVNFRAVVLDPQNQQTRSANVDFLWSMQEARGLNRVATAERSTLKGVAVGQLQVPAEESADQLELAVESPELQNRFQQRNLPLAGKLATSSMSVAGTGLRDPTAPLTVPSQLSAKPEGGSLVAGVQNRLLYLSQNNATAPATPLRTQLRSANVEDSTISNGIPTQNELVQEVDFGTFDLVPEASQQYTVEVVNEGQPPLEQQSFEAKQLPATFQINNGVAPSNEPLDIDVRVAMPNTTMALVAGDDNSTIGYNLWDVGVNAPITQPVQLNLPPEATGSPTGSPVQRSLGRRPGQRTKASAVGRARHLPHSGPSFRYRPARPPCRGRSRPAAFASSRGEGRICQRRSGHARHPNAANAGGSLRGAATTRPRRRVPPQSTRGRAAIACGTAGRCATVGARPSLLRSSLGPLRLAQGTNHAGRHAPLGPATGIRFHR